MSIFLFGSIASWALTIVCIALIIRYLSIFYNKYNVAIGHGDLNCFEVRAYLYNDQLTSLSGDLTGKGTVLSELLGMREGAHVSILYDETRDFMEDICLN